MEVRSRQDAKSVCIKRRHGAMSAGKVLEEDCFVCYVKAVALIGLRGCGQGEKRRRGGRSLAASALSKIGAGVALPFTGGWRSASSLFFLEKAGHVCLLFLLRGGFYVVEIGRVPSIHNIQGVSSMTIADGAVRIS